MQDLVKPSTGRYMDGVEPSAKQDVWVMNQAGRVFPINAEHVFAQYLMGRLDPKYAQTNLPGWRLATPEEIEAAKKQSVEDGKKWIAQREAELAKKQPKVTVVTTGKVKD